MTGQSLIIWFIVGAVALSALVILVKLIGQRRRSWMERDLRRGDLRALSDFASRRIGPASVQIDRLRDRGFLVTTARGRYRMSAKGWVAILLRRASARRVSGPALASTAQPRGAHVVGFPKRNRNELESDWAALRMAAAAITRDFLADGISDAKAERKNDQIDDSCVRHVMKHDQYRATPALKGDHRAK
jgi:hypothetical protein